MSLQRGASLVLAVAQNSNKPLHLPCLVLTALVFLSPKGGSSGGTTAPAMPPTAPGAAAAVGAGAGGAGGADFEAPAPVPGRRGGVGVYG